MPIRKLNGICVLAVDDTDDNVSWIRLVLELEGATVFFASNASEALDVLENVIVDVFMTELRLPGVDGFELLRMIRAQGPNENANVPAIAMSATSIDDNQARAQEVGFALYLTKPLLAETIVNSVTKLLAT